MVTQPNKYKEKIERERIIIIIIIKDSKQESKLSYNIL